MFESARKVPVQSRSKARQENILQVAEELIAGKGSEAMSMSELAATAGISIGSLYQHFRDKGAVLAALAERYHAASTACIKEELSAAESPEALREAFQRLVRVYFEIFRASPAMRDVWTAIQSDKALRTIEMEANYRNGGLLAEAIGRSAPSANAEAVSVVAFTIMALGEATMRLAVVLPESEAEAVVACYAHMAINELAKVTSIADKPSADEGS